MWKVETEFSSLLGWWAAAVHQYSCTGCLQLPYQMSDILNISPNKDWIDLPNYIPRTHQCKISSASRSPPPTPSPAPQAVCNSQPSLERGACTGQMMQFFVFHIWHNDHGSLCFYSSNSAIPGLDMFTCSHNNGSKCFLDTPLKGKGEITRQLRHLPSAPSAGICLLCASCLVSHLLLQGNNLLNAGELWK